MVKTVVKFGWEESERKNGVKKRFDPSLTSEKLFYLQHNMSCILLNEPPTKTWQRSAARNAENIKRDIE